MSSETKSAERTAGKWETSRALRPTDGAYDFAIGAEIEGTKYCIAEVVGRAAEDVWLPAEANARFIVRAANSHDALLAALKEAQLQIEYLHDKFQTTSTGVAVLSRINAAIASAQEN